MSGATYTSRGAIQKLSEYSKVLLRAISTRIMRVTAFKPLFFDSIAHCTQVDDYKVVFVVVLAFFKISKGLKKLSSVKMRFEKSTFLLSSKNITVYCAMLIKTRFDLFGLSEACEAQLHCVF